MLLRSLTSSLLRRSCLPRSSNLMMMNQQPLASFATTTGVVKWFDVKKGFGFVVPDDGSTDVFVHHSEVHKNGFRTLAEGEPVEFEVEEGNDGRRRAVHVTGPDGVEVQGTPPMQQSYGGFGDSGGFGGSDRGGGGGFGGGGGRGGFDNSRDLDKGDGDGDMDDGDTDMDDMALDSDDDGDFNFDSDSDDDTKEKTDDAKPI